LLEFEIVGVGATAKVYRDGNTALKLYQNTPLHEVEQEAAFQRFAYHSGLPVPAVYGIRKIDGNAVALAMESIDGQPLIQPRMDKEERRSAIHTLVKLQCEIHKVHANGLPKQSDCLKDRILRSYHFEKQIKDNLVALLGEMDDGAAYLCHGDLHPLNILTDGTNCWVIDWVNATAGNPLADACRTYLILKQFISRSAGTYLRLFYKETGSKQEDVLKWQPVIATARMTEIIDEKTRGWLEAMVRDTMR